MRMPGYYLPVVKLMKWQLAIGLLFCVTNTQGQQNLSPDTTGAAYTEALSRSYALRNERFLERLKTETKDKKLLRYYEANYKELFETLQEKIKEREIISIPEMLAALERMLGRIRAKNPAVPDDIQLLLLRDDNPNAYALGDNTLFVTLGLFAYLENEDQVAGVLAHEIGHLQMEHTLKAFRYNYERDKESAAQVKAIRQAQTRKADKAFDVLKSSVYRGGKLRRAHEMQADSAGYELIKNTGYQRSAFAEALDLVSSHDTIRPDGLVTGTYKRFFDLPDQKFQDKWLKVEDFSSYNYGSFTEKFDKDSISTHPKGKERIQYLKTIFPELSQQNAGKPGVSDSFNRLRLMAEKQQLPNLFFKEQYGDAIYVSLLHLQESPDDTVYKEWLGKGFRKIYEARRDYQLNRYLDRVDPKNQSESYIQFLSFMWNLKPDELKKIADFYTQIQ